MDTRIDPHLKIVAPRLALGGVYGTIEVTKHDQALWSEIDHQLAEIGSSFTLEGLSNIPQVKALRDVYRALGKDPSRYRGSQESLLRRVLQRKGLFTINTVVDINNLISLESGHSVGCYDCSQVHPPVVFRIGQKGESYKGIGKELINLDGLPVFADGNGPFGSPTSDSERAMITLSTRKLLMVVITFSGSEHLQFHIGRMATLLMRYAKATESTLRRFMVEL
jgi:DNA/RNA-binding domain of Phe-tRNA-synthetase-like protein